MAIAPATRLPPEIILAPLPPPPSRRGLLIVALALAVIAVAVSLLLGLRASALGVPLGIGVLLVVLLAVRSSSAEAARRERKQFHERYPAASTDARVQALVHACQQGRVPKPAEVCRILEPFPCPERARLVCFGVTEVPEVGEHFFEPEIITATELLWRRLIWLWIALGMGALWLLDYVGLWPSWLPPIGRMMQSCNYVFILGTAALVTWIWRGAIFPTYFRLAPGIIQVLIYRYGSRKPTIRSYPLVAGTRAILVRHRQPRRAKGKKKSERWHLTLMRGRQKDSLEVWQLRRPQERIERIWQALLSTAPTPPLSDEELVG